MQNRYTGYKSKIGELRNDCLSQIVDKKYFSDKLFAINILRGASACKPLNINILFTKYPRWGEGEPEGETEQKNDISDRSPVAQSAVCLW